MREKIEPFKLWIWRQWLSVLQTAEKNPMNQPLSKKRLLPWSNDQQIKTSHFGHVILCLQSWGNFALIIQYAVHGAAIETHLEDAPGPECSYKFTLQYAYVLLLLHWLTFKMLVSSIKLSLARGWVNCEIASAQLYLLIPLSPTVGAFSGCLQLKNVILWGIGSMPFQT